MTISLQKADLWKRISAYLFDVILCVMITIGFAAALSTVFKYDSYTKDLEGYYAEYQTDGIDFNISDEDYNKLSPEEQAKYVAAKQAFLKDARVIALYDKLFVLSLVIAGGSLLLSHLILYFAIPLFFKDGKTLGKKIFGLAVIRTNCVQLTTPVLFIRAIIGQCVMETLFPVCLLISVYFGFGGVGMIAIFLLFALQIGVMIATKTNSAIHDLLTDSVVVDFASQQIFASEEERIAYIEEMHRQETQAYEQYPNQEPAVLDAIPVNKD